MPMMNKWYIRKVLRKDLDSEKNSSELVSRFVDELRS